jgi:TetR/AcrR family transcriptional regulator, regulator of cefoperazone and chloramphenicol sensitivity
VTNDAETRARVLATARRLFGERGFKAVTVREICSAAKANLAAVNYHFGDKLGLYREVLQEAVDAMRETTETAREAGRGRPPEEQLRAYVHVFMRRVLSGDHSVHRLVSRELKEPTPALDLLVEQGMRPRVEYLSGVIARIVGCDAGEPRVLRCVASVQSQVVSYFPNPVARRLGMRFEPTPENIEEAARHVAAFSIAGVRAVGAGARSRRRVRV